MADWSTIEAALEDWVGGITGLPVYWRHRPFAASFNNDGLALLSIISRKSLGHEDLTYTDTGTTPGEEIVYYQSGQRQFTLRVQIRTHRQTVGKDAKQYTSEIRDRLALPATTTAPWSEAGIAFARVLSEIGFDSRLDGRELSVANLDILVNASALAEDAPIGYIETVHDADLELDSTVRWTGDLEV